jgi:NAD(P)-dependent dehydrogenase (short-subunit alcohol dehydrogenase family)
MDNHHHPPRDTSTGTGGPLGRAAVTGAGRGIGLATALELARRGHPVTALVEDASMVAMVMAAAEGLPVTIEVLDVTAPDHFAFPDDLTVLVNNAGARREFLPVEHISLGDWRSVFEVNVFAAAELCRRAIPVLRANGGGVICNVTSSAVLDLGPFFGAYRCSKAAASALCEQLRVEVAPFGIRIVEVLPGPTRTAMANDGVSARVAEAVRFPEYEQMARRQRDLLSQQPDWASPEDVAQVIAEAVGNDQAPMRHGSDNLSRERLLAWRRPDDEQLMQEATERYRAPQPL